MTPMESLGLDVPCEQVYRAILANPGWNVQQLSAALSLSEEQVYAALDRLFQLTLLRKSFEDPERLRAVTPDVGLRSLLARQEVEVARQQQRVAECQAAVAVMVADYATSRPGTPSGDAERLTGIDAVHTRIEQLAESARGDILAFTPGGAQSGRALEVARLTDSRLLERGVVIREVLQDSCRNDPATSAYTRWLAGAGGQVRTVPVLPARMILVDREIALLPVDPADSRAGLVQLAGRGTLAALVALFEQVWAAAVPLSASAGGPVRDDRGLLSARERELINLLGRGLTDEGAARHLGISARTARRIMAELMERMGARSRFEAGLKIAQEGWAR